MSGRYFFMDNELQNNLYIYTNNKLVYLIPVIIIILIGINIGFSSLIKTAYAKEIMVYKTPTCDCCKSWIKHLRNEGFNVTTKDIDDVKPVKKQFGISSQYQSCHTAKVGKYFIEGHVHAFDIRKLLNEKSDVKGLSVPGMPVGSPGMEGKNKEKYNVLAIDNSDKVTVYSSYE